MLDAPPRAAMKHISSRQHPIVAAFRRLARGKDAGASLLLDGPHLVQEALATGIRIETAVLAEQFAASEEGARLLRALAAAGAEVCTASPPVVDAASPVSSPAGIVAIAARPGVTLDAVLGGNSQLVVIALDVQDPGNAGAIVRAAEAGGATGAAFCGASADPLGWKALRGSMGSALRLPVAHGVPVEEAVAAARARGLRVLATATRRAPSVYEADLRPPLAFLLGGEGPGLSPRAAAMADAAVSIPMAPQVESLNVAVAGALLVYEARRQRGWREGNRAGGGER